MRIQSFRDFSSWWQSIKAPHRQYIKRLFIFFVIYTFGGWLYVAVNWHWYHVQIVYIEKYITLLVFPFLLIFTAIRWSAIQQPILFKRNIVALLMSSLFAVLIFFIPLNKVLGNHHELTAVICFIIFYLLNCALFIAIFGLRFVNLFIAELVLMSTTYVVYLFFGALLLYYWRYFSFLIIKILALVFPLISPEISFDVARYNVTFNSLNVNIGPVCAGFYSLVSFTLLFAVTLLLVKKYRKIRYVQAVGAWITGLAILFILNILRIIIIVIIGGWWSAPVALNFFHEYVSAIFLILLFLLYVYYVLPRITQPALKEHV